MTAECGALERFCIQDKRKKKITADHSRQFAYVEGRTLKFDQPNVRISSARRQGADNALWYGRIFEPKDEDSKAMATFNEEVNADHRVEKLFLTLRDGIYLIRKKQPD